MITAFLILGITLSIFTIHRVCKWDDDREGDTWLSYVMRNIKSK